MGWRRTTTDSAFYELIPVFDDNGALVSGQTQGDFTVTFIRNGVEVVGISYTITEVGTQGRYSLSVSAGFPATGTWFVVVDIAYNDHIWRSDVEVTNYDIDDVYAIVVIGGGDGVETMTLTVVDTANGDAPIVDVLVYVYNQAGTALITYGRTDANGELEVNLDSGTYLVKLYSPGYSSSNQSITVTDTGGVTPQADQLEMATITVVAPSSPALCRLYADFFTMDGLPLENFLVRVENKFDPSAGFTVGERVREFISDASGHVEFDLKRGLRVRIAFVGTSHSRDIEVPEEQVANLTTVFGVATDNFVLVSS